MNLSIFIDFFADWIEKLLFCENYKKSTQLNFMRDEWKCSIF